MDWGDLAKQVVMLGAPTLGQALGGPFGGMAGKILASALGATQATPAAVNQALTERPPGELTVAEAVQKAESEWLTALTEIGKAQVTEVGETQRAEILSEDPLQRWWRPLYALELSFLECPVFAGTVLHALWSGHEIAINGFANLSGLFMAYFAARFGVLGVYVAGRSREKQAVVTGHSVPSIVAEVVKAMGRKR
jgi:hypothetical protein